jgi:hypothetical protein
LCHQSDEIEEQLEAYVESNLKRWTKFFESNLAVCCPKLNNLNWAASEEGACPSPFFSFSPSFLTS